MTTARGSLTEQERCKIQNLHASGMSERGIATEVGRSKTTVHNCLHRNGGWTPVFPIGSGASVGAHAPMSTVGARLDCRKGHLATRGVEDPRRDESLEHRRSDVRTGSPTLSLASDDHDDDLTHDDDLDSVDDETAAEPFHDADATRQDGKSYTTSVAHASLTSAGARRGFRKMHLAARDVQGHRHDKSLERRRSDVRTGSPVLTLDSDDDHDDDDLTHDEDLHSGGETVVEPFHDVDMARRNDRSTQIVRSGSYTTTGAHAPLVSAVARRGFPKVQLATHDVEGPRHRKSLGRPWPGARTGLPPRQREVYSSTRSATVGIPLNAVTRRDAKRCTKFKLSSRNAERIRPKTARSSKKTARVLRVY